jgi:hypothetical protein
LLILWLLAWWANTTWEAGGERHRIASRTGLRAALIGPLLLAALLQSPRPLAADPIPVLFVEGAMHGFLGLRTFHGALVPRAISSRSPGATER